MSTGARIRFKRMHSISGARHGASLPRVVERHDQRFGQPRTAHRTRSVPLLTLPVAYIGLSIERARLVPRVSARALAVYGQSIAIPAGTSLRSGRLSGDSGKVRNIVVREPGA
jgi:hypothetical protein